MTAGDIRRKAERKRLLEKKRGYCECCLIRYEHIDQVCSNEKKCIPQLKKSGSILFYLCLSHEYFVTFYSGTTGQGFLKFGFRVYISQLVSGFI